MAKGKESKNENMVPNGAIFADGLTRHIVLPVTKGGPEQSKPICYLQFQLLCVHGPKVKIKKMLKEENKRNTTDIKLWPSK